MQRKEIRRYISSALLFFLSLIIFHSTLYASDLEDRRQKGSVIFIHPDGSGLNLWDAARMYWKGPDKALNDVGARFDVPPQR